MKGKALQQAGAAGDVGPHEEVVSSLDGVSGRLTPSNHGRTCSPVRQGCAICQVMAVVSPLVCSVGELGQAGLAACLSDGTLLAREAANTRDLLGAGQSVCHNRQRTR